MSAGGSASTKRSEWELDRIASSDLNVLITGQKESELRDLAVRIHGGSPRQQFPLVRVIAPYPELQALGRFLGGGELPPFLGEAEHRPGADGGKAAPKGTLFVEQVGELPPDAQKILLRILESRETGLGSRGLDLRIIATSGPRLGDLVATGRFRSDLYFRLEEIRITAPSILAASARRAVMRAEKRAIEKALAETSGNLDRTAELLSMSSRALQEKIRRLHLSQPWN